MGAPPAERGRSALNVFSQVNKDGEEEQESGSDALSMVSLW